MSTANQLLFAVWGEPGSGVTAWLAAVGEKVAFRLNGKLLTITLSENVPGAVKPNALIRFWRPTSLPPVDARLARACPAGDFPVVEVVSFADRHDALPPVEKMGKVLRISSVRKMGIEAPVRCLVTRLFRLGEDGEPYILVRE